MLGQLWPVVFLFFLSLGVGNVVRQMGEEVTNNFGGKDLMNPYLVPGPSLEVNIAEWILNFAREECQPGVVQRRPAPTKQKTVYFRRTHGVRNQARDFIGDE